MLLFCRHGAGESMASRDHGAGGRATRIAIKLMGFERGTILAGLPVPITTPAHGTAFDIAKRSTARIDALREAYRTACRMARQCI
jgi:4-hydroxythreonine-4-phosphate dehydrogenase